MTSATPLSKVTPLKKTSMTLQSGPRMGPVRAGSKAKALANEGRPQRPLVLPPSVSQISADKGSSSDRDNRDHAHTQPSSDAALSWDAPGGDCDGDDNPLRDLFLRQGILPPFPRPAVVDRGRGEAGGTSSSSTAVVDIPEPDPSGVSRANAEDVLDLASMYDPSVHLPDKPDFTSPANRSRYEEGTPLTDELVAYIGVRGPITVAEYMRRALRDGKHGYYTGKGSRDGRGRTTSAGGAAAVGAAEHVAAETTEMEDDNDWDLDDDEEAIHSDDGDSTKHVGGEHVIGSGGDFITAPEVSQLFGESLLVWLMTQYQTLGSPSRVQIVEIGPGKGTLICDILRSAVETFPDFASALTTGTDVGDGDKDGGSRREKVAVGVHLVEVTNGMRARQRESIRNLEMEKAIGEKGYSFRFSDNDSGIIDDKKEEPESFSTADKSNSPLSSRGKEDGQQPQSNIIHFTWHDVLSSIPTHDARTSEPVPTFVICQELVDALPIHSFQKAEADVWRERLVDVAVRDEGEAREAREKVHMSVARRYASAEPIADAASSAVPSSSSTPSLPSSEGRKEKLPRLRFVLPPDTTPAIRALLRVDSRGKPIVDGDHPERAESLNSLPVGSIIEACPEALLLAQDVADRIEKCRGAALIIDYGGDGSSGGDTLRGFRRHAQVHPLSRPGETDVTADVDFGALREAVNSRMELEESLERKLRQQRQGVRSSSSGSDEAKINSAEGNNLDNGSEERTVSRRHQRPEAFGPITQGRFLASMGIVQRVTKKIEDRETTDDEAEELFTAMERLMAAEEMGERYKVLAIAAKKEGLFPPPGF